MLTPKTNDPRFLWIKAIVLLLALAGVFWARSSLNKATQATPPAPTEIAPIPAKVEFGK
jgi:hypothetical protein